MLFFRILSFFILFIVPRCSSAANPKQIAEEVLNKLYSVHGQLNKNKPRIEIIEKKLNVAAYLKAQNLIQIENFAFQLCRSFGKDSLNALAFIIGHELIHAINASSHLPQTSFIAFDKIVKGSIETEREADIQGIFICYLAGFRTIEF